MSRGTGKATSQKVGMTVREDCTGNEDCSNPREISFPGDIISALHAGHTNVAIVQKADALDKESTAIVVKEGLRDQ